MIAVNLKFESNEIEINRMYIVRHAAIMLTRYIFNGGKMDAERIRHGSRTMRRWAATMRVSRPSSRVTERRLGDGYQACGYLFPDYNCKLLISELRDRIPEA